MHQINYLIKHNFNLIKIKPKSKMPAEKDWTALGKKGLNLIEASNAKKENYNFGVRTGAGSPLSAEFSLLVVDFDIRSKDKKIKQEALEALKNLLGDLKKYPMVISGSMSGSAHIYLKCATADLPKSQYIINTPFWNIMLCSTGKQVIVPPSTHPDTQHKYRWLRFIENTPLIDIKTTALWTRLKQIPELDTQEDCVNDIDTTDIDQLSVSNRIKSLIQYGDDHDEYPSRSEAIYAAIHALVRSGVSQDSIISILTNPEYLLSEGVLERSEGWLLPQIKKAYAEQLKDIRDDFDINLDELPRGSLKKNPFEYIDPAQLPQTEWIIPNRLASKFITLTVAPGGSGKTTLAIQEAISVALGKPCGAFDVRTPGNVWLFNNEDPRDELYLRIYAICNQFNINPKELEGKLFVNSGRFKNERLVVAKDSKKLGKIAIKENIDSIEKEIQHGSIKLLVVDPFTRCHYLNENDNSDMDLVADIFVGIADRQNCAINLVHHSRKMYAGDKVTGNADSIRGASALVNAARIAHTLTTMSEPEAQSFGIEDEKRVWYSRFDNAKNNLSPPSNSAVWYKKHSVPVDVSLGLERGDQRGVLVPWLPPELAVKGISQQTQDEVLKLVRDRWEYGEPLSKSINSDRSFVKLTRAQFGFSKKQAEDLLFFFESENMIVETLLDPSSKKKGLMKT